MSFSGGFIPRIFGLYSLGQVVRDVMTYSSPERRPYAKKGSVEKSVRVQEEK